MSQPFDIPLDSSIAEHDYRPTQPRIGWRDIDETTAPADEDQARQAAIPPINQLGEQHPGQSQPRSPDRHVVDGNWHPPFYGTEGAPEPYPA